ncbi:MAG: hypothetical protein NZ555_13510, partial [Geminicoccaceae bacterium]|nr:hypothetical protein [Geminicoccaceae bacterium]
MTTEAEALALAFLPPEELARAEALADARFGPTCSISVVAVWSPVARASASAVAVPEPAPGVELPAPLPPPVPLPEPVVGAPPLPPPFPPLVGAEPCAWRRAIAASSRCRARSLPPRASSCCNLSLR